MNQFIYLLSMCQMCQRWDIESFLATISSSSSSPLTPTSLFCDPFIISHLTVWQNGSAAVKHLQGHSTGHASTFCLAISWSVQGMRERGRESIWSHHCQETERRGVRRGRGLEGVGGGVLGPISNSTDGTTRICCKGCKVYSRRKLIWTWIKQRWQIWW